MLVGNFDTELFRTSFPEFSDKQKFPTSLISGWAGVAVTQIDASAWGNAWNRGVSLYVAHELLLESKEIDAAKNGGATGNASPGVVNSKTVGQVTVAYDTQSAVEKDAGHWNLTIYGRQYYRLMRIFGAGAIQL
jgi:hypothetical protein